MEVKIPYTKIYGIIFNTLSQSVKPHSGFLGFFHDSSFFSLLFPRTNPARYLALLPPTSGSLFTLIFTTGCYFFGKVRFVNNDIFIQFLYLLITLILRAEVNTPSVAIFRNYTFAIVDLFIVEAIPPELLTLYYSSACQKMKIYISNIRYVCNYVREDSEIKIAITYITSDRFDNCHAAM